jgi:hypothetical protein
LDAADIVAPQAAGAPGASSDLRDSFDQGRGRSEDSITASANFARAGHRADGRIPVG